MNAWIAVAAALLMIALADHYESWIKVDRRTRYAYLVLGVIDIGLLIYAMYLSRHPK